MNKETAQILINDLISDVDDVVLSDPRREVCIWWRGRLSGVVETIVSLVDDLDLDGVENALVSLYEAEDK